MKSKLLAFVFLAVSGLSFPKSFALTVESKTSFPAHFLFQNAKRYLVKHFLKSAGSIESVIKLEDSSTGILRFVFQDGSFVDKNSLIEIIDLDPTHSKLRVTIPSDFKSRDQLLLDQILKETSQIFEKKQGVPLPFESRYVFQSVRRYLLKRFVHSNEEISGFFKIDLEDLGLIRFHYREDGFSDSKAMIEVISLGEKECRLIVSLPNDSLVRQNLLEKDLLKSIEADLGKAKK